MVPQYVSKGVYLPYFTYLWLNGELMRRKTQHWSHFSMTVMLIYRRIIPPSTFSGSLEAIVYINVYSNKSTGLLYWSYSY